jgi:hypothetical protein
MSIELHWDNPDKTILRLDVKGRWTWDEMYQSSDLSILMRQSVNHPVFSIVDFTRAFGLPDSAIAHAKNIMTKQDGYRGVIVFIQPDFAFISLWKVMMKVYGRWMMNISFLFAESLDEAREMLNHQLAHQEPADRTV